MKFIVTQKDNILTISAGADSVRWLCSVEGNFSLGGYGGITTSTVTIMPNDYNGIASGYIYFIYFDNGCMRQYTHQVIYEDKNWESVFPEKDRFEPGFDNQYKEFTVNTNKSGWTVNVPSGYTAVKVSESKFYLIKQNGNSEANIEASIRDNQVTIGASVDPTAIVLVEPTAVSGLVYNGNEQALVTNGKSDSKTGVIVYKLDNGGWSTTLPKAIDANEHYTVCYMASGKTGYKNSEITCIENIKIDKAPLTVTPPTPITGLTYNAKKQELIIDGYSNGGTIEYSLSESGGWSTSIPTGIDADDYTIYYRVTPDYNHSGTTSGSVTTNIAKGKPTVVPPVPTNCTYTGNYQKIVTPAYTDFGTLYYMIEGQTQWATYIPTATNAGTYIVQYKTDDDVNMESVTGSVEAPIYKVTPTVIPPIPYDRNYTGSEIELIAPGSTNFGILEYKASTEGMSGQWSTSIPTGINVGNYLVSYRVEGDDNINSVSGSVTAEISINKPEFTPPVGKTGLVFDGTEQELLVPGSVTGGTMYYSFNYNGPWEDTDVPTASGASAYTTYWYIVGDEGRDDIGPKSIHVTIDKAKNAFIEEPTASAMTYMEESISPYKGIPQQLVTSGISSAGTSGGTILYKTSDTEEWIEIVPSGTDAGDYTIYYMISGNSNFYDTESANTNATIDKKTPQIEPPKSNAPIVYDGQEHALLISGSVLNGWGEIVYSTDYINWSTEVPSASTIGSYTVFWKLDGDKNHNGIDAASISVDIAMGVAEITKDPVVIEGLEYTGEMQNLITAGEAKNGTMVYRIGNGEWSTEIPQAKDKGSYVIYYMASGDTGYSDSSQFNLNCSIGLAKPEYTEPKGITIKFDGGEHRLITEGTVIKGGTMEYSLEGSEWSTTVPKATKAQKYTILWRIVPTEGYSEVSGTVFSEIEGPDKPSYDPPSGKTLTFNDTEQELVDKGKVYQGGTMEYSLNGTEWSTSSPLGIEAKEYIIYWRITATEEYSEVTGMVSSVIKSAEPTPVEYNPPKGVTITYDGSSHQLAEAGEITVGTGKFYYKLGETGAYDESIPTKDSVGTYEVYWRLDTDKENYASGKVTSTITSLEWTAPRPKEGLVYNGENQDIVEPGTGEGVEFQYSVDGGTSYSTAIPERMDANEYPGYKVYWVANKVMTIGSGEFFVTIAKAESSISFNPSTIDEMSIGDAKDVVINVTKGPSNPTITYSSNRESIATCNPKEGAGTTITAISTGEATITATLSETTNYKSASATLSVTVKAQETYSISIGGSAGSTSAVGGISDITFGTSIGYLTLVDVNQNFDAPEEGYSISAEDYARFSGKTITSVTITDMASTPKEWECTWTATNINDTPIDYLIENGHYHITASSEISDCQVISSSSNAEIIGLDKLNQGIPIYFDSDSSFNVRYYDYADCNAANEKSYNLHFVITSWSDTNNVDVSVSDWTGTNSYQISPNIEITSSGEKNVDVDKSCVVTSTNHPTQLDFGYGYGTQGYAHSLVLSLSEVSPVGSDTMEFVYEAGNGVKCVISVSFGATYINHSIYFENLDRLTD